jgi:FkbM family methyltransferase
MNDVPWGELRPSGIAALSMGLLRHHLYAGRTLKHAIHRVLEHLGPYYDLEADGLRFRCRVGDNGGEMIVVNRRKLDRRQELHRIVDSLRSGDTFVDAGANFGMFSLYGAQAVGPSGRVLAIEPNPTMLERLRFNVAANGFANVAIAPVALGAASGKASLNIPTTNLDRASLLDVRGQDAKCVVPVETLSSVVASHGLRGIAVLKIDIEGYEDRALLPFFASAPRELWPRRILIERNDHLWEEDCVAQMLKLGYQEIWAKGRTDSMLQLA